MLRENDPNYNKQEMQIIARYCNLQTTASLLGLKMYKAGVIWITGTEHYDGNNNVMIMFHRACGTLDKCEQTLVEYAAGEERREAINESSSSLEERELFRQNKKFFILSQRKEKEKQDREIDLCLGQGTII